MIQNTRAKTVQIRLLRHSYRQRHETANYELQIPQLSVSCGEFVVITGPTGVGKSTICSLLAGLRRPTSVHEMIIDGFRLHCTSRRDRSRFLRQSVAIAMQQPALISSLTVAENIAFVQRMRGEPKPRLRTLDWLAAVSRENDLVDRARSRTTELSGGQRQRVGLAMALSRQTPLVVLDEPTSALDAPMADRMLRLIDEQRDKHGTAVVLVTQHPERAEPYATRNIQIDIDDRNVARIHGDYDLKTSTRVKDIHDDHSNCEVRALHSAGNTGDIQDSRNADPDHNCSDRNGIAGCPATGIQGRSRTRSGNGDKQQPESNHDADHGSEHKRRTNG